MTDLRKIGKIRKIRKTRRIGKAIKGYMPLLAFLSFLSIFHINRDFRLETTRKGFLGSSLGYAMPLRELKPTIAKGSLLKTKS